VSRSVILNLSLLCFLIAVIGAVVMAGAIPTFAVVAHYLGSEANYNLCNWIVFGAMTISCASVIAAAALKRYARLNSIDLMSKSTTETAV